MPRRAKVDSEVVVVDGVPAPEVAEAVPGETGGDVSPELCEVPGLGVDGDREGPAPSGRSRRRFGISGYVPLAEGHDPRPLPEDVEGYLRLAKSRGWIVQAPAVAVSGDPPVLDLDLGPFRGEVALEESGCSDAREMRRLVGQHVAFVVRWVDGRARVARCSRRAAVEEMARRTWEVLAPGAVRQAVVRGYARGGVLVDIGGVSALVPYRELSRGFVFDAESEVPLGSSFPVRVLSCDRDLGEVLCSRKEFLPDPWEDAASRYREGDLRAGVVVTVASRGVFVQLEPGVEAFCPKLVFDGGRVARGCRVVVRVDRVDPERRRMGAHITRVLG
ncbi:MAG: S1 RNA-binding domain-containing protein [Bacillota bacterium]